MSSTSVPSTYGVFINLPVASIDASIKFYTAIGFVQNKNFSDKNGVMMSWPVDAEKPTDTNPISVMLLTREFFTKFINPSTHAVANSDYSSGGSTKFQTQFLPCLAMPSVAAIDHVCSQAESAGGKSDVVKPQIHTKAYDPQAEHQWGGDEGNTTDAWMYGRNFTDIDGHEWELMFMDMGKMMALGGGC